MALPLFLLPLIGKAGAALLGLSERKMDAKLEHHRIDSKERVETLKVKRDVVQAQAAVVRSAHSYAWFWIPWLIAAVPASCWFAWGVLDSTFNGNLQDVTELPPQLKAAFDIVFSNIFVSGAAVGGVQVAARAATSIFSRR